MRHINRDRTLKYERKLAPSIAMALNAFAEQLGKDAETFRKEAECMRGLAEDRARESDALYALASEVDGETFPP